jgi:hypothetical protein
VLLVLAHFATRSSAARRQRRWVGGCARRRLHNFVAASFVKFTDVSHRLGSLCHGNLSCAQAGSLCHALVSSRACWPNHRFGVLLGSRGNFRGRPARVRRPAVGSPKELARGNWHASIYGCAVTGARKVVDVGGCLGTRGARKWRLEGVGRGEIVRRNVGIRVCGRGG